MNVFISQSNYIPWKGFFDAIHKADVYVLYDDVQYTKGDWRNRNRIKTPNGPLWLTIPVKVKGRFFQSIREVEIEDQRWASRHWKSICMNYSQAPFFKSYGPVFEALYEGCNERFLSDVNMKFLRSISAMLGIETRFEWSSSFPHQGDRTERLVNICKSLNASRYITGPSARSYLNTGLFDGEGIDIEWMDFSGYPEYPQQFGSFIHEVSVIDLIFNAGPLAPMFMKSFKAKNEE